MGLERISPPELVIERRRESDPAPVWNEQCSRKSFHSPEPDDEHRDHEQERDLVHLVGTLGATVRGCGLTAGRRERARIANILGAPGSLALKQRLDRVVPSSFAGSCRNSS